jgi:hypothetical protein
MTPKRTTGRSSGAALSAQSVPAADKPKAHAVNVKFLLVIISNLHRFAAEAGKQFSGLLFFLCRHLTIINPPERPRRTTSAPVSPEVAIAGRFALVYVPAGIYSPFT